MVKIEQTGGRLTEEEILHGKEDAMESIRLTGKVQEEIMLSFLLILYVQKEKYQSEQSISLFTVIF